MVAAAAVPVAGTRRSWSRRRRTRPPELYGPSTARRGSKWGFGSGEAGVAEWRESGGHRTQCGDTPLHLACMNGNLDVVRYLLSSRRANLEARDNSGNTPLHWACWCGRLDVVRYLLSSHGANLEATDNNGQTPLHLACGRGDLDVVRYLLSSRRANLEATDQQWLDTSSLCL